MNNYLPTALAVAFLWLTTACTPTSGPVVIRETVIREAVIHEADSKIVRPVTPDESQTMLPFVENLVAQAKRSLAIQDYEQAINLAEKGLRINRKDPRLYLLLAKAYREQHEQQQSIYFAKQGLRYSKKGDDSYSELISLTEN